MLILPRVLQYFSLYITLRSFCCMSIYMYYTEIYMHTLKVKHWLMSLALCCHQLSDEKTVTLGVGVTLNGFCCYGYQFLCDNILLKFVFNWALSGAAYGPSLGLLLQILSAWVPYKFLDALEIRANLTAFYHILAWISHLEVCSVCQYICNAQKHTHIHSN